jgi:fumarate reductase iron-sulfur subunit
LLDDASNIEADHATDSIAVSVWRGDADGGEWESFTVPRQPSQTVLDIVTWIQQEADPTLTYRFACRVGMCGSCAMMVNDEPRWTCRTHVGRVVKDGAISIAPLRNLPVIKDLATDMDPFFDKWVKAEATHHPSAGRHDDFAAVLPDDEQRVEASAGIECTLYNDSRDDAGDAILDAVSAQGGCHSCHSMGSCTHYCPNDLDPMGAIAGLKRATAKRFFGRGRG